jgi:hypothetical protein
MKHLTLTAVSLLLFSLASVSSAQIPQIEREALIALYNSTDGENWKSELLTGLSYAGRYWLRPAGTECTWEGVVCSSGSVSELYLFNNSLNGSIPAELGNLTNLTWLNLETNSLTGSIPAELGNLTNLTRLDLLGNSLTGSIPTELGNLTNLTKLLLYQNSLSGSIPSELGNMTSLEIAHLQENSLTGSVPAELGNLTNLTQLILNNNSLSGSIPAELGNLTGLTQLQIDNNSLSGSIPAELGNLTGLRSLWLHNNSLTGSIPAELGNLTNLVYLSLGDNLLTGPTPQWILDRSWTYLNLTNAFDVSPSVAISGGNRTIADTDGIAGESVSFTGTATDSDGTITATEWYVGGSVVATGLTPTISLPNGSTVVTFKATDNAGLSSSTTVTITVEVPNVAPSVSISGGNRTLDDTDSAAGESVSFTGSATDSDGDIALVQWLVGGVAVATDLTATIALPNGSTVVTFKAYDNDGDISTTTVTITITNIAPSVSIPGGNGIVVDTDSAAGESVELTGTASDTDGSIVTTEWLVGGSVVATGLTATIALPNGSSVVTFKATDNDGGSATATATITITNIVPSVSISGGNRIVVDTDGAAGESVSFAGTATDTDGTIATTEWLVGGSVVATGLTATIALPNGTSVVTFRATDNDGGSAAATATITIPNFIPSATISEGNRIVADSDGVAGESVNFTGTATDADGSIATTEWLVGGSVVATGLTATIALPNGSTIVTFRVTDNDGDSAAATATITIPNFIPSASISGGNRIVADSDGVAGESVNFTGTATDADGTIATTEWLVGNSVVATGLTTTISLPDGTTALTFKVTDNDGASSTSTGITITVEPPNGAPMVVIAGGNRSIADTDGAAGEAVSFTATATDTDGNIAVTQWLVGGATVVTGLNATIALPNGTTDVTFKATDNGGKTSSVTVTITVEPPNVAPSVAILRGDRSLGDTNSVAGESVTFTATATDTDGNIALTQWLVGGSVVATGLSATISLPNGTTVVTFKATDNEGGISTASATITVREHYVPTEEWPSPYNGVTPDSSLGLDYNNIGTYNTDDSLIYTCLRVFTDGLPGSVNGIGQFDIGLAVVSSEQGTVQVTGYREFNVIGALNENVELPDCSGKFETTTAVYTDTIETKWYVNLLGNLLPVIKTYNMTFDLIDGDNLILKLSSYQELTAD